jgi:hypothetical protein
MTTTDLYIGARYIRDQEEYRHWHKIRLLGFTEWYVGGPEKSSRRFDRHAANAKARLFPEFFYQVRTREGRPVAYLATVPGYWSGENQSLQDLPYYEETLNFSKTKMRLLTWLYLITVEFLRIPRLFDALTARYRQQKLDGSNCIVLLAMTIDPEFQRLQIPTRLLSAVKSTARILGMKYVIGPFRPNAYGKYKAEQGVAHSNPLFEQYCSLKNDQDLPQDPWMRVVSRNGAQFVKLEYRSYRVSHSIEAFERLRRNFKPESWYSPAPDTWECGETPTWYVDYCKKTVLSVEPNIWGYIPVAD